MTSAATEEQPSTSRPVFELEEGQSAGTTSPQEDTLERPTSQCELDEGQPAATSPQQDTSKKPETSQPIEGDDEPLSSDPAKWPSPITGSVRTELVRRGPTKVPTSFVFPRSEGDGRCCHHHYFNRTLTSGEKVARSWMLYSVSNNSLVCFCCKLFSKRSIQLTTSGLADWTHASSLLNSHEKSPDHINCMKTWKEFTVRLMKGKTIDKKEMALLEDERVRWRAVLTRLTAIVQSLAVRNLALRGHTEALFTRSNGNFLKEVELMARFDPIMKEHINRIQRGTSSHTSYLGHQIQNELIELLSNKIISTIVSEIKQAKFFSIILDCTPDNSNIEQLSVVIRFVEVKETTPLVKECFLGFFEAVESTGSHLASMTLDKLKELDIPFEDCRGQSYDNGSNMRGKNKGVQARLLQENPRALFMPCVAHTLNLVVSDAANDSVDAMSYFGILQKIYNLFSASTQRWTILKSHVNLTLKMWSDTRWESKIKSIEPFRYEAAAVREALIKVRETTKEPKTKVEAQSLSEEVGSYRFSICTAVWYDILFQIQHVSKLVQSPNMAVDVAVNLLRNTHRSLEQYRETGFKSAQIIARDTCADMNVEVVLKEKRLRSTKRHYSYEATDEPISDALKRLEVSFFNVAVDAALSAILERFTTLEDVGQKFAVLTNFPSLSDEELAEKCDALGTILEFNGKSDLDRKELVKEMKNFPSLPPQDMLGLLTFLHKNHLTEIYPNLWTGLRIALTVPMTVAEAERSFSKLKLIKNYLRSTMSQERLSGLSIISINFQVGEEISYDDIIDEFASRKARKQHF
nr:zinc finger MYM-type protein 1-like isoform X2 [Nothobranchius furzeri]XP_054594921.1 zinc finger MYM-type protein 1-like isoform X2 [Nothobranchius furzeri]XP_054595126.1 zinc finger MYM-type protein 1-like isoform X2 [Nothobranchius furzeri]